MGEIIPRPRLGSSRNIFRSHLTTDLRFHANPSRTLDEVRCFQGMKCASEMFPSHGYETLIAGGRVLDLLACYGRPARHMEGIAVRWLPIAISGSEQQADAQHRQIDCLNTARVRRSGVIGPSFASERILDEAWKPLTGEAGGPLEALR